MKVNYSKYNNFFMSAMKGIKKDHKSSMKDFESLFYSMKDQCKIFFALHFRPYIPIPQYLPRVSCVYDIIKSPTFRILFRKSPEFTSALIFLRYVISFYLYMQHILFEEGMFWDVDLRNQLMLIFARTLMKE